MKNYESYFKRVGEFESIHVTCGRPKFTNKYAVVFKVFYRINGKPVEKVIHKDSVRSARIAKKWWSNIVSLVSKSSDDVLLEKYFK